jgi:hypothetical protein
LPSFSATVIAVPLFRRFKLSAVLGYPLPAW